MYDNRVGDKSLDSVVFGEIAIMFGKNRYICIGLTIRFIIMKRVLLSLVMLCVVAATAMAGVPQKKPNAPKRDNLGIAGYQLWGDVERVVAYDYDINEEGEDILTASVILTFTERGDVASHEYYNESGDLTDRYTYTYDEQGRELSSTYQGFNEEASEAEHSYTTYLEDGSARRRYPTGKIETITFDPYGNVEKIITEDEGETTIDEFIYVYDYSYDYSGVIVFEEERENGEIGERKIYSYDEVGNKTGVIRIIGNRLYLKSVMKNDEYGNCTDEIWYNRDQDITLHNEYIYDNRGNVIELRQNFDVPETDACKRVFEIEYR